MKTELIIAIVVLIYGLVCLAIAAKARLSESSSANYFVGGRSFGIVITVCTVVMGIYSGLTFYGFPSTIMNGGIFPIAATGFAFIGIAYPFIGYRMWKMGKGRNYITLSDFLSERYESSGYGLLCSLIQLIFIIPYMTVQFVAVANGLTYSTNNLVSYPVVLILYGLLTIAYLVIGGAKGTSTVDIFNAALAVVVPLVAIFIVVGKNFDGSFAQMGQTALEKFPNMMDAASFGKTYSPINILGLIISGMVALFAAPHIASKFFMASGRKTFQKMTWVGPVFYTILTIPIVLMGMLGIALYKGELAASEADFLVPKMMMDYCPLIIVILMLWVLLAFCMSTTNGFTFAAATVFSNDLIMKYGMKNMPASEARDKKAIFYGKIGVVVVIAATVLLALTRPTAIVDYAYTFATPGFAQILPAMIFGMYWKRASKQGAIAGTVVGLATLVVTLFIIPRPLGIHPVIWSLGLNIVVFLIVSFATRPSDETVEKFFGAELDKISADQK